MTRINLVDVDILTNKHLMAEYREIQHIPKALARSLKSKQRAKVLDGSKIPPKFKLNTGHVTFFFNKGKYLHNRFQDLRAELLRRKFNLKPKEVSFDVYKQHELYNDYIPNDDAYNTVLDRIVSRILEKPHLYPDKEYFFDQIQQRYEYPLTSRKMLFKEGLLQT